MIFKSENVEPSIEFDVLTDSKFGEIVAAKIVGPESLAQTELKFALKVVATIYAMIVGAQVVVTHPDNVRIRGSAITDGADLIQSKGMLSSNFIDQDFPLFPAGGYQNPVWYLVTLLDEIFSPLNHRMKLGRLGSSLTRRHLLPLRSYRDGGAPTCSPLQPETKAGSSRFHQRLPELPSKAVEGGPALCLGRPPNTRAEPTCPPLYRDRSVHVHRHIFISRCACWSPGREALSRMCRFGARLQNQVFKGQVRAARGVSGAVVGI